MIDKIVLSQDRKNAMIHYDTHSVGLYHSEGLVLDLIALILSPIVSCNYDITWNSYMASFEDTQPIIDLEALNRKAA